MIVSCYYVLKSPDELYQQMLIGLPFLQDVKYIK